MSKKQVSFIISATTKEWMRGLDRAEARMHRFGNSMIGIGSNMGRYLTVPTIGVAAASTKMASDFELALSKMQGLVGLTREEVQAFRKDILDMAGDVGKGPQELAEAMFFITSAGLRGSDALEVLEASAKASAAGLGETKVVADLVTSAMNAYGPNVLNAAKATDILVATVREGKAEPAELAASMGQVLPIASNMGVTFDQVGAAIASMTRTGTDAGTASIQLRQILSSLLSPAVQAEDALKQMGTSSAELRKQIREEGLISVLGFLREQMNTNEQAMAQVFGNVRALSGALDIMGANASDNIQIFSRLSETGGELDDAFDAIPQHVKDFDSAVADLKASAIEFGGVLLPIVAQGISGFAEFASRMNDLSDDSKIRLLKLVGVIAIVPPAIIAIGLAAKTAAIGIGVLNGLVAATRTVFMAANTVLSITSAQIKAVALASWMLVKRIAILLGVWTLILGAFAASAAGTQWVYDNWIKLKQGFELGAKSMELAVLKMVRNTLQGFRDLISFVLKNSGIFGQVFGVKVETLIDNSGFSDFISKLDSEIFIGEQYLKFRMQDFNNETWGSFGESARNAINNAKQLIFNQVEGLIGAGMLQKLKGDFDALFSNLEKESTINVPQSDSSIVPIVYAGEWTLANEDLSQYRVNVQGLSKDLQGAGGASSEMSNRMLQGFNATNRLANTFANSFGSGLNNIVVEGERVIDVLENIGKLMLSSGIQLAVQTLLTGGLGGTGFFGSGGGLIGRIFGVNDALIRSDGSIVRFHPKDNILAMKDFGSLQPASQGVATINADFKKGFKEALDEKLSSIGPNELFILGKMGEVGF